jgi:hypothetical protein
MLETLIESLTVSERLAVIVSVASFFLAVTGLVIGGGSVLLAALANRRTKLDEIDRQADAEAFRLLSIASGGPETYLVSSNEIRGPLFNQQIISIALLRQYPRQFPALVSLYGVFARNEERERGNQWNPWALLMVELMATIQHIRPGYVWNPPLPLIE